MGGDPRFTDSHLLPPCPYAEFARLLGLDGMRVDDPANIGDAWDRALSADRPIVLEMVTDPEIPPIPPHIEAKQAQAYAQALLKENESGSAALRATIKQWWA